jgi:hypothetical protein
MVLTRSKRKEKAGQAHLDQLIKHVQPTKQPVVRQPNRFRHLLDTAANPPAFEEPQEPPGVIFKKDDGVDVEPPVAPSPP